MAHRFGQYDGVDVEYTDFEADFEAWCYPYVCREKLFTSTAALNMRKAMFHVGPRLRFGNGDVAATSGLFGGRRTGAGAVPAPASSVDTQPGGKKKRKKKKKKQPQGNAPSPPSPPSPVTENVVVGSSLDFSEKGKVNSQILTPPSLTEENSVLGTSPEMKFLNSELLFGGGGGSDGGGGERTERAGTGPAGAPGTGCKKTKKKRNKKKGTKTGTANAHVSAAPTFATPNPTDDAFMDFLFRGGLFGGARGGGGGVLSSEPSEDDSDLSGLSDMGYGCFDGYDGYMGYDDSDDYEGFDGYDRYMGYDDYDDSEDDEDSDDVYSAYCLNKIISENKPSSGKGIRTSVAACDDFSCYLCNESVGVKHEYLLHMATLHRSCGACRSKFQEGKMQNELGFEYRGHFKSAPNCLYNPKFKLGRVEITEISDSEAVDNPQVKLGEVESTDIFGTEAVDSPKLMPGKVKNGEVHESEAVDRRFVCLICGQNSASAFALNEHYGIAHYKCQCCKIQFDAQDDLSQHFLNSKVHLGKYCETCKMVFSSKKSMGIHFTKSHSAGTSNQNVGGAFTCDACTKVARTFPTEDELEAHLQFEHVRCFPCMREFGQKKSLRNHLTAASQHNFCVRCDGDFMSSKSLKMHNCPGNAA